MAGDLARQLGHRARARVNLPGEPESSWSGSAGPNLDRPDTSMPCQKPTTTWVGSRLAGVFVPRRWLPSAARSSASRALPQRTQVDNYNFACNLALAAPLVGDPTTRARPMGSSEGPSRSGRLAALRRAAAGGFSATRALPWRFRPRPAPSSPRVSSFLAGYGDARRAIRATAAAVATEKRTIPLFLTRSLRRLGLRKSS